MSFCSRLATREWYPLFLVVFAALSIPLSARASTTDGLFSGVDTLYRQTLIERVIARNPSVELAKAAWTAMLARAPQQTALADPILAYEAAPATIGSPHGFGQVVRLSQRVEWPGKQALRGAVVQAQAAAKGAALGGVRRQLRLTASLSFDDYFLVQRETEINGVQLDLVRGLRDSAEARYASGEGRHYDRLKAEVSLGLLEGERLELRAREAVIIAQINGLLHRHPNAELPRAPSVLPLPDPLEGTVEIWMARAIADRPALAATAHQVAAAKDGVSLARRGYLPDFGVSGTYNSMWAAIEHRFMVGVSLNLPIHFGAMAGRVTEASAAQTKANAAHAAMEDTVRVEVQQSWARFTEAMARLRLYRERILPAARQQFQAVEAEVETGRATFASLLAVQSEVQSLERAHVRALTMTWRRHATLERAIGADPLLAAQGGAR